MSDATTTLSETILQQSQDENASPQTSPSDNNTPWLIDRQDSVVENKNINLPPSMPESPSQLDPLSPEEIQIEIEDRQQSSPPCRDSDIVKPSSEGDNKEPCKDNSEIGASTDTQRVDSNRDSGVIEDVDIEFNMSPPPGLERIEESQKESQNRDEEKERESPPRLERDEVNQSSPPCRDTDVYDRTEGVDNIVPQDSVDNVVPQDSVDNIVPQDNDKVTESPGSNTEELTDGQPVPGSALSEALNFLDNLGCEDDDSDENSDQEPQDIFTQENLITQSTVVDQKNNNIEQKYIDELQGKGFTFSCNILCILLLVQNIA